MTSNIRLRHAKDADLYATASDFCRIFQQETENLYLLALLLTADSAKAEQCFVSGLERSAEGNHVFKEWARSWARRTVIKSAVRLVALEPESASAISNSTADAEPVLPGMRAELSALLSLQPLDRFAFVTSVLEGYTDRDCTLLIGCTRESLISARTRAMQQIGHSGKEAPAAPSIPLTLELPASVATSA
jgi:DNA-directed RNA polymerase specialized sigma24 family protein